MQQLCTENMTIIMLLVDLKDCLQQPHATREVCNLNLTCAYYIITFAQKSKVVLCGRIEK